MNASKPLSALVFLLAIAAPVSAATCKLPATGYLLPGSYGLESSEANMISSGRSGGRPDPHAPTAQIDGGGNITIVQLVPPAVWKKQFRAMILDDTNVAPLTPAARMIAAGNGWLVQFRAAGSPQTWWTSAGSINAFGGLMVTGPKTCTMP